jgi:dihydropteroate synthase
VADAHVWRCGGRALDLSRPLVMGILNATPDSFSDGGAYADVAEAVAAGLRMVAEGADVVDVGGESTRPGADPVPIAREAERVVPVVSALAAQGVCVSVDTRHPMVAAAALEAGAVIVNDVSGFRDPAMVHLAAAIDAGLIAMHMLGEPRTMQADPVYEDVVFEVVAYLAAQAAALQAAGVAADRIVLDPGIGFGKTTAHNLELLARVGEIAALGYPVLVGASRKRFIGEITGIGEPRERLAGSLAAALTAVRRGAGIVRVHDVAATVQALTVARAIDQRGVER